MLEWYVFIGNYSAAEIEKYNVFDHPGFLEGCRKAAKKYAKDREAFEKAVKSDLMYHFWSKCEWEVVIDHWPHSDRKRARKVDVFEQVMLNWGQFADYVWSHAVDI